MRFKNNFDKFEKDFNRWEKERITRASIHVEGEARKKVSGTGTGRVYKRRTVTHRASKPGHPPATDTGQLRRSISREVRREGGGWAGFVGTPLKYGLWLERGTSQVKARPWLRPTFTEQQNEVLKILRRPM